MARFYSTITSVSTQGSRQERTIGRGSRNRIVAHTCCWTMGIKVVCETDRNGDDIFHVYKTGGTDDVLKCSLIASFIDLGTSGPRDRKGKLK